MRIQNPEVRNQKAEGGRQRAEGKGQRGWLVAALCALLLALTPWLFAQVPPLPPGSGASVKLAWDANPPADEVQAYYVYHTTNVAGPWRVIGNAGTNTLFMVDSSNTNFPGGFAPGVHAFYVTASNFWGESFPSDTVASPPIASGVTSLTISRNPSP